MNTQTLIVIVLCVYFLIHVMSDFLELISSNKPPHYLWRFGNFAISLLMLYLFLFLMKIIKSI